MPMAVQFIWSVLGMFFACVPAEASAVLQIISSI